MDAGRVNLVLQIARQEAGVVRQPPGGRIQDDAVDGFGAESRDGLCHGQIRLAARTGGADADGDGVFLNGL